MTPLTWVELHINAAISAVRKNSTVLQYVTFRLSQVKDGRAEDGCTSILVVPYDFRMPSTERNEGFSFDQSVQATVSKMCSARIGFGPDDVTFTSYFEHAGNTSVQAVKIKLSVTKSFDLVIVGLDPFTNEGFHRRQKKMLELYSSAAYDLAAETREKRSKDPSKKSPKRADSSDGPRVCGLRAFALLEMAALSILISIILYFYNTYVNKNLL